MMSSESNSPAAVLESLAALTQGDYAIDANVDEVHSWKAFVFSIEDLNFAFPFMGGFEILPSRDVQPLPWAKDWVRGLTNIRGDIYTVVDFAFYLGFSGINSIRNSSLFMLPDSSLKSTLLFSGGVQLKSFSEDFVLSEDIVIPENISTCVSRVIKDSGLSWIVLDVDALCSYDGFTDISMHSHLH